VAAERPGDSQRIVAALGTDADPIGFGFASIDVKRDTSK